MTKEHILQFAITIDDNAIIESVKESASREIMTSLEKDMQDVKKQVTKSIVDVRGWGNNELTSQGAKIVKEALEPYMDQIIAGAIESVAQSITRSKKYKEVLQRIADDMLTGDKE